jgi:hypothetical protein
MITSVADNRHFSPQLLDNNGIHDLLTVNPTIVSSSTSNSTVAAVSSSRSHLTSIASLAAAATCTPVPLQPPPTNCHATSICPRLPLVDAVSLSLPTEVKGSVAGDCSSRCAAVVIDAQPLATPIACQRSVSPLFTPALVRVPVDQPTINLPDARFVPSPPLSSFSPGRSAVRARPRSYCRTLRFPPVPQLCDGGCGNPIGYDPFRNARCSGCEQRPRKCTCLCQPSFSFSPARC